MRAVPVCCPCAVCAGEQLYATLQQWLLVSRDAGVSNMAAWALAYMPAREAASPRSWQDILTLLMGLSSSSGGSGARRPTGSRQPPPIAASPTGQQQQQRASGVPPARHAAELAVQLSRVVSIAGSGLLRQDAGSPPQDSIASTVSHPVTAFLAGQWQGVVQALGNTTAWLVLREVASREVLMPQQWQSLAAWVADAARQQPVQDVGMRRECAAVLGAAWSTVAWVRDNQHTICGN